jgi:hypothetical protein
MFGGHVGSVIAVVTALGFHLGVDVLQGLDFKPFWCPVFWVFLPDLQAVLLGSSALPEDAWPAIMSRGFEEEPFRWTASAAYLVVQLIVVLSLQDLRGPDVLPWTCCPMFALPRNLFGQEMRGGALTERNLRDTGTIDVQYHFYPWLVHLPMSLKDLKLIPGRVLMWTSTTHVHSRLSRLVSEENRGKEFLIASNYDVSPVLEDGLRKMSLFLENCKNSDWACSEKVSELLDMQAECLALFHTERGCSEIAL